MQVRVLGGGIYGCHLTLSLIEAGHDVELYEKEATLFAGASGACPGRLHRGPHYPRSKATRDACQAHYPLFMARYGHLTHGVPANVYAIAERDSLVDFGTYCEVLEQEIETIRVERPGELGLRNVEGAIFCGERHIVPRLAREYFATALNGHAVFGAENADDYYEWLIDATFGALGSESVDRYEPCIMALMEGPVDRAVTIMDGGFCSLYPWDETDGLSSLTSASLTPLSKTCRTYAEARAILDGLTKADIRSRYEAMVSQMASYWSGIDDYRIVDCRLSIRAMPKSAADARLVDVRCVGERVIQVRAGKIDAVMQAERIVKDMIKA